MKKYSEYVNGNVSMIDSDGLSTALKAIRNAGISMIIETGTFEGTGSTRTIGNSFKENPPKVFYTIEVDYNSYRKAVKNLKDLPFVKCLFGCSVPMRVALEFIKDDEAIIHHEKYPDIYIDDTEDPVKFYSKEIEGYLTGKNSGFFSFLRPKPSEDLLTRLIRENTEEKIFFILDSAGGIGLLEFNTVLQEMKDRDFYLLLDDTHHIKHFRSVEYIKNHPQEFNVIGEDTKHGWLLCKKN